MTFWLLAAIFCLAVALVFLAMTIFGKKRWQNFKASLLFGALTIMLPFVGAAVVFTPPSPERSAMCGSPYAASSFAQRTVREALKAPSSAKFADVAAYPDGACRYLVAGRVEAQNSFGAMLAHNFSVLIEFDPEDNINWSATDLLLTAR